MLRELLDSTKVIVCAGSGGVGKTTVSASLALAAALEGKKSLVLTIDPARRLANALGLQELGNQESEVAPALFREAGLDTQGRLFAMMLDHKHTFDDLVDRYAPSEENATRLRENPWYQQMSTALAGAQDYMAVEKLYELVHQRDYDLIILDTPPTSNALDFLDAPKRMLGLLQFEPFQWFQRKMTSEQSKGGRLMRWGGSAILKGLGRVTGKAVIDEVTTLLQDLSGLYEGFAERAEKTWSFLRSAQCQFLLVSAPTHPQIVEALFFQKKLLDAGMPFCGFLLNRSKGYYQHQGQWLALPSHPVETDTDTLTRIASSLSSQHNIDPEELQALLQPLSAHLTAQRREVEQSQAEVVYLQQQALDKPFIGQIPVIHDEIHDLAGLSRISRILLQDGVSM